MSPDFERLKNRFSVNRERSRVISTKSPIFVGLIITGVQKKSQSLNSNELFLNDRNFYKRIHFFGFVDLCTSHFLDSFSHIEDPKPTFINNSCYSLIFIQLQQLE